MKCQRVHLNKKVLILSGSVSIALLTGCASNGSFGSANPLSSYVGLTPAVINGQTKYLTKAEYAEYQKQQAAEQVRQQKLIALNYQKIQDEIAAEKAEKLRQEKLRQEKIEAERRAQAAKAEAERQAKLKQIQEEERKKKAEEAKRIAHEKKEAAEIQRRESHVPTQAEIESCRRGSPYLQTIRGVSYKGVYWVMNSPRDTPKKDFVYNTQAPFTVIQSVRNGVLANGPSGGNIGYFLTKKEYADGQYIPKSWWKYIGLHKYQTVTGYTKTVMMFEEVPASIENQMLNMRSCFESINYYPERQ